MKTIEIEGGVALKGSVRIPPSKSLSHRVLIASAFCGRPHRVGPIMDSEDIDATMGILMQMGATFTPILGEKGYYLVDNPKIEDFYTQRTCVSDTTCVFKCKESGSTLRFMIPFSFLVKACSFEGEGRLGQRPLSPYFDIFERQGMTYTLTEGGLPLHLKGGIHSDTFTIKGDISSQFVTGLLMALPMLKGDSEVIVEEPFESKSYVDLTLSVLEAFGIEVKAQESNTFTIKGSQSYQVPSGDFEVEGDYSQAAFFLVANALGADIDVGGLNIQSKQGDRVIESLLKNLDWKNPITRKISLKDCPDLLPILSVMAALSPGETIFHEGERVRLKESDRIDAMTTELTKMGAVIAQTPDGMHVTGISRLKGASVSAWGDHRIAMALAIAALRTDGKLILEGATSVAKSYPHFWDVYQDLGGKIHG